MIPGTCGGVLPIYLWIRVRRRAVISALAGRNCSDDQPYQQDKPSDSHFLPPKDGQLLLFRRAADAERSYVYPACGGYTWTKNAVSGEFGIR